MDAMIFHKSPLFAYLAGFLEQEELTKFTCPLSYFLMLFEYKAKSLFHLLYTTYIECCQLFYSH